MFAKQATIVPGWFLASSAAVLLGIIAVMLTTYRVTEVDVHSGATRQHRVLMGVIRISMPGHDQPSPLRCPPDVTPEWHGARSDYRFSSRRVGWRHGGTRGIYQALQHTMDAAGLSEDEMAAVVERAHPVLAQGVDTIDIDEQGMIFVESRNGMRIVLMSRPTR